MQRDEPVELLGSNFFFQEPNLDFRRVLPEFAVQVFSAPGEARAIEQAGRVACWINKQPIALGHLRPAHELFNQSYQRLDPGRFVAMDTCEKPELHRVTTAPGTVENETWKFQFVRSRLDNPEGRFRKIRRTAGQLRKPSKHL